MHRSFRFDSKTAAMVRAASLASFVFAALPACDRTTRSQAGTTAATDVETRCLEPKASASEERTLHELREKLRETPATPGLWVAAGQSRIRSARRSATPGLYANAEACAQAALTRSPTDAGAIELHALVLLDQHRFAEARDAMRALIARHPDDAVAFELLSDAELELGELDAAIEAAQHMMDLKPSLPAYGRAAHLRWLQGDMPAAKGLYQQAIRAGRGQADPEPRAFMIAQAALLFWHEGDYAGADAGYDLALREMPEYPAALEGKGRVAMARGDYAAAAHWLAKAQARTGLVETSWLLGDAYTLLGQYEQATYAYATVIREGRRHDSRTLAAFFATKDRDHAQAVQLARSELAQRHDIFTKDVLAWALYRDGQLEEARRLALDVIAPGTADARLLFHAGTILKAAGDTARGQALIERALKLNPKFDRVLLGQAPPEVQASARRD